MSDNEIVLRLEISRLREELYGANAEIDQFSGIFADYKNAAASEAERANELTAENIALCEENARLREALVAISKIKNELFGIKWHEITKARKIARAAIQGGGKDDRERTRRAD